MNSYARLKATPSPSARPLLPRGVYCLEKCLVNKVLSVTDIETEDQVLTTGDTDSPVDSDAALASALQRSGGGVYGNYPVLRVTRRAAGAASTTRRDGGGRGTPRSGALSDAQADETTAGDVGETPKWDECCSRM